MKTLGIDLGGTRIKFGVVEQGIILQESTCLTPVESGYEAVLEAMTANALDYIKAYQDIEYIGLGSPGLIDTKQGMVRYSNNFGWNDRPVCRDMKKILGKEVRIANDAQCAALGEALYGAGRGLSRMAMLTLGTGVGGGFVKDGKLETDGYGSMAYIFGHASISGRGRLCNCGRHGCLEAYASASAIALRGTEVLKRKMTACEVFDAARGGDCLAGSVVDEFLEYLGAGAVNIANILRPEVIVIGGGVSASGDMILPRLNEELRNGVYAYTYAPVQAVCAELGNSAGIMGAANL